MRITKQAGVILIGALIFCHQAFAEIPVGLAVRAIIGEARGESYAGKLAVAEALRNRLELERYRKDPFDGVYGFTARIREKVDPQVYRDAEKAWKASKRSNTVGEAIVWGNAADVKKFKRQRWFKNMRLVKKVGRHYFFEEKKS